MPSLLYLSFFYETHLQEWTLACRLLTADFKRTVEPAAAAAAGGAGAHQLSRLLARTGQLSQAGDRTWDLLRRVYFIDDIVSSYFGEMDEVVKSRNPHSDPGFQLALAEILNNYSLFLFLLH